MELKGKIAVITGAASGIGRATALRFAQEGAAGVVVADLNAEGLKPVAEAVNGLAVPCDVSKPGDIQNLIAKARERYGRIDVYFSNAGVVMRGGLEAPDDVWRKNFDIHVMAHVWAAREVVEPMIAQGGGYFLTTASAAGLLNIVESATYGVTKHATVAFSEWLSIAYGKRGLHVSCLCPQAVMTGMYKGVGGSAGVDGALSAEQVAGEIVDVMREETFLVLPHKSVLGYMQGKTANYDRWLGGMRKIYMKHIESQQG